MQYLQWILNERVTSIYCFVDIIIRHLIIESVEWSGVFSGLFSVILKRSFYYIKKFEIYFLLINFEHVLRLM